MLYTELLKYPTFQANDESDESAFRRNTDLIRGKK